MLNNNGKILDHSNGYLNGFNGHGPGMHGLKNLFVSRSFKKGELIQQPGDRNPKTYYVKMGLLRSYNINASGKEHILSFAPEGWLMNDFCSSTNGSKAELYIEALEDGVLEIIDLRQINEVVLNAKLRNEILSKLVERMALMQRRLLLMMGSPAIERYEYFLQTYPSIVNRIPQRMIASFLGITPEGLSKVKGERARLELQKNR